MFRTSLDRGRGGTRQTRRPRLNLRRATLEQLEDRRLLAVSPWPTPLAADPPPDGHILHVDADALPGGSGDTWADAAAS
ncbi:MAG: hypothetical protein JXB62_17840, partial [Pirellulales bacterium]|nr:hypothetical protein [Pirellulales bacterium]